MLVQAFIIAIFLVQNSFQLNCENDLIQLTENFLKLQNSPTKISAFLCLNKKNTAVLFKSLSKNEFAASIYQMGNIQIMNSLMGNHHQVFIIDLSCESSLKVIEEAEKLEFFAYPYRWLIFGNSSQLQNIHLAINSQIYVAEINDERKYELNAYYKISPNSSSTQKNVIGKWSRSEGFSNYKELSISRNRTNLTGAHLTISYIFTNLDTFNHLWDYRDPHVDAVTKVNYVLMHDLANMLNATHKQIIQRIWGFKNLTTGKYNAQMGDLQSGAAEIGGTPSFFTVDRLDINDYFVVTTPTRIKFIIKAPPLSYVTNVFTLPFDKTLWHFSFIAVAVIAVVVYTIVVWEWRDSEFRKRVEENPHALKPNFFDVIMLNLGAITQQGSDNEPKSLSGRIATFIAFLLLMALYTSYSASIVVLLQSTTDSIKTSKDLLNSNVKLGVEDLPYNHYYMEKLTEPIRKAIYDQKIAPKGQKSNFFTAKEGIRKVKNGFFAFHVELTTGYKIIADTFQENEKCALIEIDYLNLHVPWLPLRRNSTYKEIVKVAIKKILESGVQNRVYNRIYSKKPQCHSRTNNFQSVGLTECYSAFLLFGVGCAISLFLLLFEILLKKYCSKWNVKMNMYKVQNN